MKRRTFLKRGLLGGTLLALGGGAGLWMWPARMDHSPRGGTKVLDSVEFAVLAAIAARVVRVPGADPVAIAHTIDDSLARAVPEAAADLKKVLRLFENALVGLVLDRRSRPFTRLDGDEQDRVLLAWRDSSLVLRRGAYGAIRKLCLTSWYRKEPSWPGIGYSGPPFDFSGQAPNAGSTPTSTGSPDAPSAEALPTTLPPSDSATTPSSSPTTPEKKVSP